jgi:hypothetical protein
MAKLIGTDPNQVPTNADLGPIAFQDIQLTSAEWVPEISDSALNTYTGGYTQQKGYYMKIGNLIWLQGFLNWTNDLTANGLVGGNQVYITGQPFANKTASLNEPVLAIQAASGITISGQMAGFMVSGQNYIRFRDVRSNNSYQNMTVNDFDNGTGGRLIAFAGVYQAEK